MEARRVDKRVKISINKSEDFKSGFVSIIGLPNAGKSTLLNSMIDEKLAITSKKPQTTRKKLKGIYNDDLSQIVFVDTPGIHIVKTELDRFMDKSVDSSLDGIDLLIVIVDINSYSTDNYFDIINKLKKNKAKKLLVINKCDVYKEDIENAKLSILSRFGDNISFEEVLLISALRHKNISEVIKTVKSLLPVGKPYYDVNYLTDEPVKAIIADMIRQQCFYKLNKEIPYGVCVLVESIKQSKSKCVNIMSTIICDKENHKGIIIGKNGAMLKSVGTGARIAIEKFLDKKVNLQINVLVKENWRNEKTLLTNYGYDLKTV